MTKDGQTVVPRRGVDRHDCRRCGVTVLRALTPTGLDVTVDAAPLTPIGELDACLAGCATYTHHHVPHELTRRYPLQIRNRPAGSVPRQTVHPAHACGTTWPSTTHHPEPAAAVSDPDAPPF